MGVEGRSWHLLRFYYPVTYIKTSFTTVYCNTIIILSEQEESNSNDLGQVNWLQPHSGESRKDLPAAVQTGEDASVWWGAGNNNQQLAVIILS